MQDSGSADEILAWEVTQCLSGVVPMTYSPLPHRQHFLGVHMWPTPGVPCIPNSPLLGVALAVLIFLFLEHTEFGLPQGLCTCSPKNVLPHLRLGGVILVSLQI